MNKERWLEGLINLNMAGLWVSSEQILGGIIGLCVSTITAMILCVYGSNNNTTERLPGTTVITRLSLVAINRSIASSTERRTYIETLGPPIS